MEIRGTFTYGLEYEERRCRDFTLRLPTLEDVECALEAAQAEASTPCTARIERHKWARCLSIDGVPGDKVTAALLAGLPAQEWGVLQKAEDELLKKIVAASAAPAESSGEQSA